MRQMCAFEQVYRFINSSAIKPTMAPEAAFQSGQLVHAFVRNDCNDICASATTGPSSEINHFRKC